MADDGWSVMNKGKYDKDAAGKISGQVVSG